MSNDTTTRIARRRFLTTMGAAGAATLATPALLRAQSREVKVGYMLPVTGPLAFEAQLALNGLQQAVDEINGAGGIKSLGGARRPISMCTLHTRGNLERGPASKTSRARADRARARPAGRSAR